MTMQYTAPALSWDAVHGRAEALRRSLSLQEIPYFPIVTVMEKVMYERLELFQLRICDRDEMDGAEGLTDPDGEFIMIDEQVYLSACDEEPRARFTMAHELGHWFLHTKRPLARARPGSVVKPYRDPEAQANQFAAELLMPRKMIARNDTVRQVMDRFGVSLSAAENRLNFMRSRVWR